MTYLLANRRAYRRRNEVRAGVATMLAGGVRRGWARRTLTPVQVPPGSDLAADLAAAHRRGLGVATFANRRGRLPVNLFVDDPDVGVERLIYTADGSRTYRLPYAVSTVAS